jgi:hypothetical protein
MFLANTEVIDVGTVGYHPRQSAVCGLKSVEGVFQSHGLGSEAEQLYDRD